MSKASNTGKKSTESLLAVPGATGCSKFSKTRRKSSTSSITSKVNSIEKISTIRDNFENSDVDAVNLSEESPPPWSSLLMLGIDDPNRMSFTQSLAFTSPPESNIGQQETTKYLGDHIALQRRLNNYAKVITIVVLALCFAFVFSYLYKNFND